MSSDGYANQHFASSAQKTVRELQDIVAVFKMMKEWGPDSEGRQFEYDFCMRDSHFIVCGWYSNPERGDDDVPHIAIWGSKLLGPEKVRFVYDAHKPSDPLEARVVPNDHIWSMRDVISSPVDFEVDIDMALSTIEIIVKESMADNPGYRRTLLKAIEAIPTATSFHPDWEEPD